MNRLLSESFHTDNGNRYQTDDDAIVRAHNGPSIDLDTECQSSKPGLDATAPGARQTQRNTAPSLETEEADEERDELIATFRNYIKRGESKQGDAIGTQQHIKHSKIQPIQPGCCTKSRCREDNFNPLAKACSKQSGEPKETKSGSSCGTGSDDSMKHDYRRDHPEGTMESGKNAAKHAMNYKKTYLFLYNLAMFIMFLMVHIILTIKSFAGKMDDESVQGAAFIIKLLTYTQLLESIHPVLGLVPGGPCMPFLQVAGRLLVNYFLTDPEIRWNSAPYAQYLFIVWSSVEIFRYSFYALRVFKVEIYPITWARYTLFMPLYPMGGFCEAQIVMVSAEHFEKTRAYTIELPNSANFSLSLPSLLRFYYVALLGPSIFYLMRYMWSQRCKQLKEKTE